METLAWIEKYLNEAEAMIFDGNVEEALGIAESLLYDEPGYARLHNFLGWAYMYYGGDEIRAELHLKMSIRFAADYAPAYLHLGTLYSRKLRYAEAIDVFSTGLTKPSNLRTALLEALAQAHECRGQFALAGRTYREAAAASIVDEEVQRMMKSAKRCRRKRLSVLFSLW